MWHRNYSASRLQMWLVTLRKYWETGRLTKTLSSNGLFVQSWCGEIQPQQTPPNSTPRSLSVWRCRRDSHLPGLNILYSFFIYLFYYCMRCQCFGFFKLRHPPVEWHFPDDTMAEAKNAAGLQHFHRCLCLFSVDVLITQDRTQVTLKVMSSSISYTFKLFLKKSN